MEIKTKQVSMNCKLALIKKAEKIRLLSMGTRNWNERKEIRTWCF